jgi:hypothetical protein
MDIEPDFGSPLRSASIPRPPAKAISARATASPPSEQSWQARTVRRVIAEERARNVASELAKSTRGTLFPMNPQDLEHTVAINATLAQLTDGGVAPPWNLNDEGALATALTLLPIVVGTVWLVGAMVIFRIKFNPANILTLPLMVGIGVAYGIYVIQRYREDGEPTFYGKSTGRALLLSALTAVIAFGSLMTGDHRGISSLGLVMVIGIIGCLVAALVLLPPPIRSNPLTTKT